MLKNSAHGWQSSSYETRYWFCTAPTGGESYLLESMRFMSLVTPPYSPHRPPRKTARSSYSEVLAPQRGSEVAASKLVMMGLHIGKVIESVVSWPTPSAR